MNDLKTINRHWIEAFSEFTTHELHSKLSNHKGLYDEAVEAELYQEIDRRERLPMSKRVK